MKKTDLSVGSLKYIAILAVVVGFAACGSAPEIEEVAEAPEVHETTIAALLADPLAFEDKQVKIEGVISHVCRHSGDKMRVLQDDSELTVQVMLGEFTGQFDVESEGARVVLKGVVTAEVTNLDELEDHDHEEGHECETTAAAVEAMKAKGLDPQIRTRILLANYELIQPVA